MRCRGGSETGLCRDRWPWMAALAMILCVTLNPCLDKTLTVPPWRPGDLVRGTAIREVVGGKGNNVARALGGWAGPRGP